MLSYTNEWYCCICYAIRIALCQPMSRYPLMICRDEAHSIGQNELQCKSRCRTHFSKKLRNQKLLAGAVINSVSSSGPQSNVHSSLEDPLSLFSQGRTDCAMSAAWGAGSAICFLLLGSKGSGGARYAVFWYGSDKYVPLTGMFVVLSYWLVEKRLRGNAFENQLQSS